MIPLLLLPQHLQNTPLLPLQKLFEAVEVTELGDVGISRQAKGILYDTVDPLGGVVVETLGRYFKRRAVILIRLRLSHQLLRNGFVRHASDAEDVVIEDGGAVVL